MLTKKFDLQYEIVEINSKVIVITQKEIKGTLGKISKVVDSMTPNNEKTEVFEIIIPIKSINCLILGINYIFIGSSGLPHYDPNNKQLKTFPNVINAYRKDNDKALKVYEYLDKMLHGMNLEEIKEIENCENNNFQGE